jgi:serine/threonine-protein phosphatase 2A activator
MYNVEVLSKFPVVQHFPFGALFAWDADPNAKAIQASVHTSSQPKSNTVPSSTSSTSAYSSPRYQPQPALRDPLVSAGTAAPWANPGSTVRPASGPNMPRGPDQPTRAPWATRTPAPPLGGTAAPWAKGNASTGAPDEQASTRAPWANKKM